MEGWERVGGVEMRKVVEQERLFDSRAGATAFFKPILIAPTKPIPSSWHTHARSNIPVFTRRAFLTLIPGYGKLASKSHVFIVFEISPLLEVFTGAQVFLVGLAPISHVLGPTPNRSGTAPHIVFN